VGGHGGSRRLHESVGGVARETSEPSRAQQECSRGGMPPLLVSPHVPRFIWEWPSLTPANHDVACRDPDARGGSARP
jgi:hypothetical protein